MKAYRKFLTADLTIQTLIIGFPVALAIFGFLSGESGLAIFLLYGLFFIGVWQVLSGIILASVFKNKLRLWYLLGVVGFFVVAGLVNYLLKSLGTIAAGDFRYLLWMVIPLGIGTWYYIITYRDWRNAKEQLQTFWDL